MSVKLKDAIKLTAKPGRQSREYWLAVVSAYLENDNVRVLDEVVIKNTKVDKHAEAIYAQLIAEAWGLA